MTNLTKNKYLFLILLFFGCYTIDNDTKQERVLLDVKANNQQQVLQNLSDSNINKKDEEGRKQGFWIEDNGLTEVYYLDGIKNGIYKNYSAKTGKLLALGCFRNDTISGSWYYFDESSSAYEVVENIQRNTDYIVDRGDGKLIKPDYISNFQCYYENGIIKEKGLALYNGSIEFGDFFRIGPWKYYDKFGQIIKEVNY